MNFKSKFKCSKFENNSNFLIDVEWNWYKKNCQRKIKINAFQKKKKIIIKCQYLFDLNNWLLYRSTNNLCVVCFVVFLFWFFTRIIITTYSPPPIAIFVCVKWFNGLKLATKYFNSKTNHIGFYAMCWNYVTNWADHNIHFSLLIIINIIKNLYRHVFWHSAK